MRALVFTVAMLLSAQTAPVDATEKLVERGVLGAMVVVLLAAYFAKDRELARALARYTDLAEKYSAQLALNTEELKHRRRGEP